MQKEKDNCQPQPETQPTNRIAEVTPATPEPPPDPQQPTRFRASPEFIKTGAVDAKQMRVSAKQRPPKDNFFRVHPFDTEQLTWCEKMMLFECRFENDMGPQTFVVLQDSPVLRQLTDDLGLYLVVAGMLRGGSLFLWELKLAQIGDHPNSMQWAKSRLEMAQLAQTEWIKCESNMSAGCYVKKSPANPAAFSEPDWSDLDFGELLNTAYADRIIDSMEHPAVKQKLGG